MTIVVGTYTKCRKNIQNFRTYVPTRMEKRKSKRKCQPAWRSRFNRFLVQKFQFSDQIKVKHNTCLYNNAKYDNHLWYLRTNSTLFCGNHRVFTSEVSDRMSQLLELTGTKKEVKCGTVMCERDKSLRTSGRRSFFSLKLTARRRFGQNTCEAVKKTCEAARLAVYIAGETL